MAVCARNILNTMVFEWFHLLYLFTDLVSWGRDLAHILVSFGDPGGTFSDFWGSWRKPWNLMIFQGYPGGAQVEGHHPVEGNGMVLGSSNSISLSPICWSARAKPPIADLQTPKSWYQTCKLTIADFRTGNEWKSVEHLTVNLWFKWLEGLGNSDWNNMPRSLMAPKGAGGFSNITWGQMLASS